MAHAHFSINGGLRSMFYYHINAMKKLFNNHKVSILFKNNNLYEYEYFISLFNLVQWKIITWHKGCLYS